MDNKNLPNLLSQTNNTNIFNFLEDDDKTEKLTNSVKKSNKAPIGTLEYIVDVSDTIERVALKWNTIPSDILHLNRLSTRMLYPGQVLFVPDPQYIPPEPIVAPTSPSKASPTKIDRLSHIKMRHHSFTKPGHIERNNTIASIDSNESPKQQNKPPMRHAHTLSEDEAKRLDEECTQKFLKLDSKLILYNEGYMDGVLLITPSALMFDPRTVISNEETSTRRKSSSSSPLVDSSIIIPIEIISNVVLYEDLSIKDVHNYIEKNKKCEENELNNPDDQLITKNEALRKHSINNIQELFNCNDDEKNSGNKTSNILLCYLCIKVNTHKDFMSCPIDRKMKNKLQSEFWFQVPDNSYRITDRICAFFLTWRFDPTYAMSNETTRGGSSFKLVTDDKSINKKGLSGDDDIENLRINSKCILMQNESFIKDWEIVNLTELENKLRAEEENDNLSLPKLIGETKILNDEHLKLLNCNLISRAVSYDWILTFSTELHGFSLNTVYRQMNEIESPSLIIVKDTNNNIFGAMTSCKLYSSDHYYGTGESFLFTFYPKFKIFKWTGENNFFIKGSSEYLSIGCGDGANGLWIDGDLYHGHTQKCKTYDNDILTSNEDFVVAAIEIFTFLD